jgi:hypothetical protein
LYLLIAMASFGKILDVRRIVRRARLITVKLYRAGPVSGTVDISDEAVVRQNWSHVLKRDPYYNPRTYYANALTSR